MRWVIRAVLGVLVLVLVVAGVLVKMVVFPTLQRPGPTDVIVILGPSDFTGQEAAGRSVVNVSPRSAVLDSWYKDFACPGYGTPVEVCFVPTPDTTEGEARFGAAWAKAHGATSITVVAPQYQASRARLWFRRCWSGRLSVVSAHSTLSQRIHMIPYQAGATLKAELFERHC